MSPNEAFQYEASNIILNLLKREDIIVREHCLDNFEQHAYHHSYYIFAERFSPEIFSMTAVTNINGDTTVDLFIRGVQQHWDQNIIDKIFEQVKNKEESQQSKEQKILDFLRKFVY